MGSTASSTSKSGGIGIASLLGCIFITLKLLQVGAVASWSWWWVLSPFWIPVAVVLAVFLVAVVVEAAK